MLKEVEMSKITLVDMLSIVNQNMPQEIFWRSLKRFENTFGKAEISVLDLHAEWAVKYKEMNPYTILVTAALMPGLFIIESNNLFDTDSWEPDEPPTGRLD